MVLIIIFALCFIPSPRTTYNSKNKLEIVSAYGDNQAYHPKVLAFPNGWNGYKYWMSYTPYPNGEDKKENPHIAVSNDMINWITPNGLKNPLDDGGETVKLKRYNSDSHIVYNPDTNIMYCYWRYVDDIDNKSIIYRLESRDGIHWNNKMVTAHSNDRKKKDYVSPAILYENSLYKMWYVDKKGIVRYATSQDGISWIDKNVIDIKYEKKLQTWHLDIISTQKGYEMIVVAFDNWKNHNDMSLYYTSSLDGMQWNEAKEIIKPTTPTKYWDNKGLYRSSFIYENGNYYVFYGGTSKKYTHGIGFMYGKDILHLKRVNTNFKNKKEIEKLKKKLEI